MSACGSVPLTQCFDDASACPGSKATATTKAAAAVRRIRVPLSAHGEVGYGKNRTLERGSDNYGKLRSKIGWISIPFGATPVCPCRKSKKPAPRIRIVRFTVCHELVGW